METSLFVDHETIRLTAEGVWLSNGSEITHLEQIRAFARNLGRDEQGYFIRIGHDFKRIEVEDTAYFVTRIEGDAARGYQISVGGEPLERLDPATLTYRPGRLACRVLRGGQAEEAKFLRAPYAEILKSLDQKDGQYVLRIEGQVVYLGAA